MKRCLKCNQDKNENEFGKDKQKKDGLNQYCKSCIRIRSKQQRIDDPEYHQIYAEKYRIENREILRIKANKIFEIHKEKRLNQSKEYYYRFQKEIAKTRKIKRSSLEGKVKENNRQKKWRENNKEKYRSYVKKWQQKNRIKHNAHQRVHRAIEDGILIRRESCEECDMKCKTEGHHEDYLKPLNVIWLCRACHAKKIETIEV